MKKTLAVFFGGRACEHDISIVTGLQFIENVDKSAYHVIPVYIARSGEWFTGAELTKIETFRDFDPANNSSDKVAILPNNLGGALVFQEQKRSLFSKPKEPLLFDVAVLAMHGLNGEDGTLQGVLEMADVPYTSSGTLGSAVSMDKILMKTVFQGANIPVLPGVCVLRDEWERDADVAIAKIEKELQYPLFVKPANLGSSIGISKATDRDGLFRAIEIAIRYDRRILIENGVENLAEYNCSAIGFNDDVRASVCEQPVSWEEFLSFEDKYLRGSNSKKSGMESMGRMIPAPIDQELTAKIQDLTCKIFKLFDCKGVVRIDFIYDLNEKKLYANEINNIPGSFAFYLWEPMGINYKQLIDLLVQYAIAAHKEKKRSVFAYDSDVLKKTNLGAKQGKFAK